MNAQAQIKPTDKIRQNYEQAISVRDHSTGSPAGGAKAPEYILTDPLVIFWLHAVNRRPKRHAAGPNSFVRVCVKQAAHALRWLTSFGKRVSNQETKCSRA